MCHEEDELDVAEKQLGDTGRPPVAELAPGPAPRATRSSPAIED